MDPAESSAPTTRDRILQAAEDVFGRRGYDAASIAEIAQASGVSTGLIYYHFTDKESLLRALVEQAVALFGPSMYETLRAQGPASERLSAFIDARVRVAAEHHNLVRILMRPATDPEGALAAEVLAGVTEAIEMIAAVVAEGMEAGEFEPADPYLAAEALFALLHTRVVAGELAAPYLDRVADEPDTLAAFITRLFLNGLHSC